MTIDELISAAGGAQRLALAAGVQPVAVRSWRYRKRIPIERALAIHRALPRIKLHEIRPDVFPAPVRRKTTKRRPEATV